jgi:hypothetical protein
VIFRKKYINSDPESRFNLGSRRFHLYIAGVFGLAVMSCLLPPWFVDKHILLDSPMTRFGLPLAIPATFVLVFLLSTIIKRNAIKYVLLVYLAFCSTYIYRYFLTMEKNWKSQKYFYSQIMWRYPKLPVGISFLANYKYDPNVYDGKDIPYLSPVINFIYGHSNSPVHVNYMAYLVGNTDYTKNDSAIMKVHFDFQKNKQIPLSYEEGTCIKFGRNNGPFLNGIDPEFKNYLLATAFAPDSIGKTGQVSKWPSAILGKEVSKNCYCYYFQKAEYYNSLKMYKTTDSLFTDLKSKNKKIDLPKNLIEWIPFIKALLNTKGANETVSEFRNILSPVDLLAIDNTKELIIEK